jgi:starch synthase
LAARGHDVRVVLPLYGDIDRRTCRLQRLAELAVCRVPLGKLEQVGRYWLRGDDESVKVYLLENEELYGQEGVYAANGQPFAHGLSRAVFHVRAALQLPELLGWAPEVIHCHDAEAALTALYHQQAAGDGASGSNAQSLLTIHNLAYQEIHPAAAMPLLGLPAGLGVYPGPLEFHGQLNLLKAGILSADAVNTVSPTYAQEVISDPELGCGLDGVLMQRGSDFSGIINGADLETWNPAADPLLPATYTAGDLSGKEICRDALCRSLALQPAAGPLVGMVSRLVDQKGLDLLLEVVEAMVAAGFTLAVLGTGQKPYETGLAKAARRHPGRVAFENRFDEELAHRILAGSDLYLMPSRYEPCGLTQMYALRYGSVPLVRQTGGLADTVRDAGAVNGTGFTFRGYSAEALWTALARARQTWFDRQKWQGMVQRGMACDFSWDSSASAYETLYRQLSERQEELP